jgi:hypothetical protein
MMRPWTKLLPFTLAERWAKRNLSTCTLCGREYHNPWPGVFVEADPEIPSIFKRVGEYANAVGRYGPDSLQAHAVRRKYSFDREFIDYADGLDRVKQRLGGSGMTEED